MNKQCIKCKQVLDISLFRRRSKTEAGLRSYCKKCQYKASQESGQKNKSKFTGIFDPQYKKVCALCKIGKSYLDYYSNNRLKDGLRTDCKKCANERSRIHRQQNDKAIIFAPKAEKTCLTCKVRKLSSDFYIEKGNSDNLRNDCKECHKTYSKANPQPKEKKRISFKKYYKRNKDKVTARCSRYRAHKGKAAIFGKSYDWLIELLHQEAKILEEVTGGKYHVDHITPLRGKTVCGLHVPWNLRVIKAVDNIRKGNRLLSV